MPHTDAHTILNIITVNDASGCLSKAKNKANQQTFRGSYNYVAKTPLLENHIDLATFANSALAAMVTTLVL